MLHQRTIRSTLRVTGIGLHTGRKINLSLKSAPADSGFIFQRTDLKGAPAIKALAKNISATENATTLGEGANVIHTVEHLLAVLYGLGINNAFIEVDAPEIPIMDGSGASFVYLLKEAGVIRQNKIKNFMVLKKPVKVKEGDAWVEILPYEGFSIDSTIIFPHPLIQTQRETFEFSCENFINEISRARTFGLLKDVEALKARGLIKGGSLDTAIVLDDYNVLNQEGLRFKNEFVRHKILDALGDLSLLGHDLAARVRCHLSGHKLHKMLCQEILTTPSCYEILTANELQNDEEIKKAFQLPLAILAAR